MNGEAKEVEAAVSEAFRPVHEALSTALRRLHRLDILECTYSMPARVSSWSGLRGLNPRLEEVGSVRKLVFIVAWLVEDPPSRSRPTTFIGCAGSSMRSGR